MSWLHSIDVAVFRFINGTLSNPFFDRLMPFLSGNDFFVPALVLCGIALIWKGGKQGRIFLLLAVITISFGDGWIVTSIKEAIARPRPFLDIADVNLLAGRGRSYSMPSSHTANWFAATMVAFMFYRRSWRFMLPGAVLVSFSRIYNGVHYPTDILVGAVLGAGYAAAFVVLADATWQFAGRRWFPLWWQKTPSLVNPNTAPALPVFDTRSTVDQHWLRLGYIFIFALLAFRLFYINSGKIELSEDEAYQWVWSKHLALSYFSKPPLIAYTQFLGTFIWGDTELGVRFFSPVIAAILSLLLLRFFAREIDVRAGLVLVAILTTTPLTSVGSILMTIDPLSVLFWTAAMIAGWRAIQDEGTARDWLWVGLWMGLGFLSKYTNLFQLLCWVVVFALYPASRKHLRKPGPYLALFIVALSLIPVLIWNAQHDWITLEHVANNGGLQKAWKPTLKYTGEFLGAEAGLLNPVYFVAILWAAIAFWKAHRNNPLYLFLFSMGAPVFLFYFALSFRSRIHPNWIAPSIVPLFCLMVIYFYHSWPMRRHVLKPILIFGISFGLIAVALLHDTDVTSKIFKRTLPVQVDPLRRVRGWSATANVVERARQKLAADGKPTFIIGDHYGITGELSFYLPEAKKLIRDTPLVYCRSSPHPRNQFYFWPGYESRVGQNAIYVQQIDLPKLDRGWFRKWLRGGKKLPTAPSESETLHREIKKQFASVTEVGVADVIHGKRVVRRLQIFECRDLLEQPLE